MFVTILDNKLADLNAVHFSLYQIYGGFYQQNGWKLTPNLDSSKPFTSDVVFPGGDFSNYYLQSNISNFNYYDNIFVAINSDLKYLEEITHLENHHKYRVSASSKIKEAKIILEDTLSKCRKLFPGFAKSEFNVSLGISHYGTYGSHSIVHNNPGHRSNPVKVELRIREDEPLETLAELFVSSLVKSEYTDDWKNEEAVVDYIVKNILGIEIPGTLERLGRTNTEQSKVDYEYQKMLGLPVKPLLNVMPRQGIIELANAKINHLLSPYEFELLQLLVRNRFSTVTYDEIAREIYKTECDKRFTFWGITKNVQRLRKKLADLGLPDKAIQNVRGVGFKLAV